MTVHAPYSSHLHLTLVYETYESGRRAAAFGERLARQLGHPGAWSDRLWRLDLLQCPPVANWIIADIAACDYLILSLSGKRMLSSEQREWLEDQLDGLVLRGAGLIVLLGTNSTQRMINGIRHYMRLICAAKEVDFYCQILADEPEEVSPEAPRLEECPVFQQPRFWHHGYTPAFA